MQFVLILYSNESAWVHMTSAEREHGMAAYSTFNEAMQNAGILRGGNRLRTSPAATTVRVVDGKTQVQEGPHSDLGGYCIIDVADHDAAIAWAARFPAASHGAVEVRPL